MRKKIKYLLKTAVAAMLLSVIVYFYHFILGSLLHVTLLVVFYIGCIGTVWKKEREKRKKEDICDLSLQAWLWIYTTVFNIIYVTFALSTKI